MTFPLKENNQITRIVQVASSLEDVEDALNTLFIILIIAVPFALLVASLGHFIFAGTPMGDWVHLLPLGVLVALAGQLGDLVLSAIKRDLGLKDIGTTIPGHGGLLDRFDSILLVAPAAFHYIGFFNGVGKDEPARLMSSIFGN